ncbi:hypothetical protein AVEN_48736-1 [Araneus ventricosus]|uniref:Uncharacterized protein n=1 Tax=Araneus ventricosus TaxID=182803 RepID=A0A4Y2WU99_ARAVE|nr:hypothetical protein AVEN_48736-1 [Araneus ventricosus]
MYGHESNCNEFQDNNGNFSALENRYSASTRRNSRMEFFKKTRVNAAFWVSIYCLRSTLKPAKGDLPLSTIDAVTKIVLWVYGVNSPTRRIMKNEERNRHLIFHVSPQFVKISRGQAEEQKSHIRELDRIYRADGRANETAEETERRRSEDRLRIIARRNNMSAEETQQRHSDDRLRANARRNSMTTEERRSEDRLRRIARRNNITAEKTEQRRSEDILRKITGQNNMTAEETQQ